jgi:ATP adenylyltransferase
MEFLWSPWRYDYMASVTKVPGTEEKRRCVFCIGEDTSRDEELLVLYRGSLNFVILNLFPYTTGHLMVAPYRHSNSLIEAPGDQTAEMMDLSKRSMKALTEVYHPEGFNVGMNLGHVAGAGVRDHFHLHVVARWAGDSNFMTITGETRVIPEDIKTTFRRLKPHFS